MEAENTRIKKILLVDDDAAFLEASSALFQQMAGDRWNITTAQNHAQTLALMAQEKFDVVVLDIGMPGVDGIQVLRLLGKAHPGQQIAMLTGHSSEERSRICLEAGASLFLEKPTTSDGYASIFAALDTLADSAAHSGFNGMMRQVGLQEILQLECLGRKSSILEVITPKVRSRIHISDGSIVHAECGTLRGEVALYSILALRGGQFNLRPYIEPEERTISGQWEFLLMEAARICDENAHEMGGPEAQGGFSPMEGNGSAQPNLSFAGAPDVTRAKRNVQVEEIVMCSGAGDLLFDSNCPSLENRLQLLQILREQVEELAGLAPVGAFDRLEISTPGFRTICQVNPERRLLVATRNLNFEAPVA